MFYSLLQSLIFFCVYMIVVLVVGPSTSEYDMNMMKETFSIKPESLSAVYYWLVSVKLIISAAAQIWMLGIIGAWAKSVE